MEVPLQRDMRFTMEELRVRYSSKRRQIGKQTARLIEMLGEVAKIFRYIQILSPRYKSNVASVKLLGPLIVLQGHKNGLTETFIFTHLLSVFI